MSRETILRAVLVLVLLSSHTDDSHGRFSMQGSASVTNGFLTLTNTTKHAYSQAFDLNPIHFKNSFNDTATSFSVTFFFAIVPEQVHNGSHGMAFVISPTNGIQGAAADQYLGIFNPSNNGSSSNHIIAVELDIHKDEEFEDINDNHVGININGMNSEKSAPAGYHDHGGEFRNLSLISGDMMRVTIIYSETEKLLNVTLSPADMAVPPERPLLSLSRDLSPYLLEEMYLGFTASTGSIGAIHYMWIWNVYTLIMYPNLDFDYIPVLPPYPRKASLRTRIVLIITSTLSVFLALVASVIGFYFYSKHKKVKAVVEEWEIQFGPHRFEYKELFKATKGFKEKQLLGKGGFGEVYKGNLPGSNAEIAVKRVSHDSHQGMREFLAEISTIGRLRHPNLVRLLGYCRHKAKLYLVYDFMPNGSLDKFLYRCPDHQKLNWSQRFKIIKDVAAALHYLHHQWVQVVIHRDIKPANVLIDHDMNARLGDFGLAKLSEQGYDPMTTNVAGTFGYMAPELVITGKATTSTDVYTFGLFMLEVACGRRPIKPRESPDKIVLVDWILDCWERGDILEAIDGNLSQEQDREQQLVTVLKLGVLCAHRVPAARPAMSTVMKILDGVTRLPDNLLDLVKVGRYEGLLDTYDEVIDVVNLQNSLCTFSLTEPFTSRGR